MTEQNKTGKFLQEYWDFVIQPTLNIPIGSMSFSNNEGYIQPSISYKHYKTSNYYNGKNRYKTLKFNHTYEEL